MINGRWGGISLLLSYLFESISKVNNNICGWRLYYVWKRFYVAYFVKLGEENIKEEKELE